ncbi:hypothetical protein ABT008_19015 [Micromonospora sp. NPDC002389]|uniref:hypothetical protein n=1 Tax=Micromonospora sp. NPDC002389 TaxID=3154272 RepID=UPI00332AA409
MRARQLSRWTAGLVAVAAVGTTTACGGAQETTTTTAPERRGTPTDTQRVAEEKAAEKAALAAYAGYLTASRTASRRSDPQYPELTRFLGDPLLTRVRLSLVKARDNGAVSAGTIRSDPAVTSVNLDASPPTVEIQDCLDATGYRLVYRSDEKKTVPGTRGSRHLATATAMRYPDGRWLISTGAAHRDQPC